MHACSSARMKIWPAVTEAMQCRVSNLCLKAGEINAVLYKK